MTKQHRGAIQHYQRQNRRLRRQRRDSQLQLETILKHAALMENELESRIMEVTHLSITDPLTMVYNRKKMSDAMAFEIERAQRYQLPLSLIMFDIDNFKRMNDTFGHEYGDTILIELASVVDCSRRATDIFGRWGGDEFLILATTSTMAAAQHLAERLGVAIKDHFSGHHDRVTCSFGVAGYYAGEDARSLVAKADSALYLAKRLGRDRVRMFIELPPATGMHRAIQEGL